MAITLSRYLKIQILGSGVATNGTLRDVMNDALHATAGFTLNILDGSRPTFPETVTTSNILLSISGCKFGNADYDTTIAAVVLKKTATAWSAIPTITGTAAWFRIYIPTYSDTDGRGQDSGFGFPRIDGTIDSIVGDLVMPDTTCTIGIAKTIDQFNISIT